MTRYLLDTNIISNIIKPTPSDSLLAWMAEQIDEDLFVSALTIAEIRRGVLENLLGANATNLKLGFPAPKAPWHSSLAECYTFDEKAGMIWAQLMAEGKAQGRPRSALDTMIAATAEANDCVVITDSENDFTNVQIINPLRGRQAMTF